MQISAAVVAGGSTGTRYANITDATFPVVHICFFAVFPFVGGKIGARANA